MMTAIPIMRAAPGWSPTPFQAPSPALRPRPTLAQNVVANPTTPPGVNNVPPTPSFIDSALVGAILAGVGVVAYGILTSGAYQANWKKSTIIFGAMTVLLAGKTIGDLYEVRFR